LSFAKSASADLKATYSWRTGCGQYRPTGARSLGEGEMARGIANGTDLAIRTQDEEREWSSGGAALVPMVEAADRGDLHDVTHAGRLDRPRLGRILAQRQVGPGLVVVGNVGLDDPVQMALAEHDDMVQAFATKRAAKPLRVRILPGGARVVPMDSRAHRRETEPTDRELAKDSRLPRSKVEESERTELAAW